MNCYKCATPLPDNSRFCMACGADVSGDGHTHSHTGATPPDPELLLALQADLGDDYIVEKELGRGGMAIVFLGHDKHLGRKVAIKLLPPMLAFGSGPGFVERFKREARTAATLDHQHIIPVYRVSTGGKLFWYVMKYLQGQSLDVIVKKEGALDVQRVVDIMLQVSDALDYAHQNNVVHRDIKPANIMLDHRGRVIVTDFGIAKAMAGTAVTGSGTMIGTPHYMATEQWRGTGVTGASDQYALAVSAYQLLSGHLPFEAESVPELMRMHMDETPPPLGELRAGLPPKLVTAIERGMAKDPEERFPTCTDFARAMERAVKESGGGASPRFSDAVKTPPPRKLPKVESKKDSAASRKGAKPDPAPAKPRARALLVGGAVVLVALAMFPLYKMLSTDVPSVEQTGRGQSTQTNAFPPPPPGPSGSTTQAVDGSTDANQKQADDQTKTLPEPTKTGGDTKGALASGTTSASTGNTSSNDTKTEPQTRGTKQQTKTNPPPPADSGMIRVASNPVSAISINGRPTNMYPVIDFKVPPGRAVIRFRVTDSTGTWAVDTTVNVTAGELLNLRRVTLRRP